MRSSIFQLGVQNPPANVDLASVLDVAQNMSDAQQGPLNDANVNVIRDFPGRGIRIWGARSLALDDAWRYIHIRRLISAIEDTALAFSRWAVFETNNTALRNALTHSASVLLEGIWRKGGLTGSTAAEGFYVKCDDTNNPQSVIDAGQVICEVGVAAAAPMEFLVFQIRQDLPAAPWWRAQPWECILREDPLGCFNFYITLIDSSTYRRGHQCGFQLCSRRVFRMQRAGRQHGDSRLPRRRPEYLCAQIRDPRHILQHYTQAWRDLSIR